MGTNRINGRGINWDKLAVRKEHGGMGFLHFHDSNLAMLEKKGEN